MVLNGFGDSILSSKTVSMMVLDLQWHLLVWMTKRFSFTIHGHIFVTWLIYSAMPFTIIDQDKASSIFSWWCDFNILKQTPWGDSTLCRTKHFVQQLFLGHRNDWNCHLVWICIVFHLKDAYILILWIMKNFTYYILVWELTNTVKVQTF